MTGWAANYFFGRLFRFRSFWYCASRLSSSSLDTLNTWRIALSNLSNSVFPGTFGAGNGFTRRLYRQSRYTELIDLFKNRRLKRFLMPFVSLEPNAVDHS